jgi:transposase
VLPNRILFSDCWRGYNIFNISSFKHYRTYHSKLFTDKQNYINGIDNFWNQAKRHMRKFNGAPKANFRLFLKECEWRFNNLTPLTQLLKLKQSLKQHMG